MLPDQGTVCVQATRTTYRRRNLLIPMLQTCGISELLESLARYLKKEVSLTVVCIAVVWSSSRVSGCDSSSTHHALSQT